MSFNVTHHIILSLLSYCKFVWLSLKFRFRVWTRLKVQTPSADEVSVLKVFVVRPFCFQSHKWLWNSRQSVIWIKQCLKLEAWQAISGPSHPVQKDSQKYRQSSETSISEVVSVPIAQPPYCQQFHTPSGFPQSHVAMRVTLHSGRNSQLKYPPGTAPHPLHNPPNNLARSPPKNSLASGAPHNPK